MRDLRYAMVFLFAANAADTVLTDAGLRLQLVTELNPLMNMLYHSGIHWFYLVKLSLSVAVLWVVPKVAQSRVVKPFYQLACLVYAGALALHLLWLAEQI
ncbi:DUF5658 family protein [Paenibacillus thalictri]|uniref:DUF5658 domain-containing protein n=1 Tax=Paenibacillus thalictri TaxID=2527873 RepID=A0A4Q9DX47_9BACL|nr:DUF5658 family protein [Paenibacillus thalictri]TBL81684.1 hypothetical protein EYB31_01415 [Paenibacillus thalictri]